MHFLLRKIFNKATEVAWTMSFRDQFKGDGPNMSDPSTANSRVFVGNIPTNEMTKKDLEDRFKKHGPILGKLSWNVRVICLSDCVTK